MTMLTITVWAALMLLFGMFLGGLRLPTRWRR